MKKPSFDIKTANDNPEYRNISDAYLEALDRYVKEGVRPGGFLSKVLSNDLMGAMGAADDSGKRCLPELSRLIFNHLPMKSYGSPSAVEGWISEKTQTLPLETNSFEEIFRIADRLSAPEKIGEFLGEDPRETVENIVDAVMSRVGSTLEVATSSPTARDFFFDQEIWPGEMNSESFSASSVYAHVLWRAVLIHLEDKLKPYFAEMDEEASPSPGG